MSDTLSIEPGAHILIVDDDLLVRTSFQDALNAAGFLTTTASDGISALASFKQLRQDLIILDLIMPGKDGFITCQELRGMPVGKYVPILMITGLGDTESIRRSFEAGATDFISKPINPELVVHRVHYILRANNNMKNLTKSEARLATSQQIARLGSWELNPVTGDFWGSEELARMLARSNGPPISTFTDFLSTVFPPDRAMVESALKKVCYNKADSNSEFRIQYSDNTLRMVRLHMQAIVTVTGRIHLLEGTLQDITEMRQVEDRLRMLKEAVDCLPIGITITDVDGKIIYSNPSETEMHGYTGEELVGREARFFAPKSCSKSFLPEQLDNVGMWKRECMNIRKNGEQFPVQLISVAVRDPMGRCLGIVTSCEDITNRKETEKRLHLLAYYDTLTGLPNRGMFHDRLHHALAMAYREQRKVSILFIDLDNFKDVNDTKGHDFGDKLLQEVAKRLAATMRESDTLARLGGDEFVVVLTSVSNQETTAVAAQRILSIFSQPFLLEDQNIFCSASVGIALYPNDGQDMETLVKCADTAMYQAKDRGKAQFRFFSTKMNDKVMHRVAMEQSLRLGLEKQEFLLHYQPKWDLKTSRIIGVEVLLRWQSADFGYLLPSEFISLTENTGLIVSLGE
jgi:diguanylate cyclase (GGDEF)-like protein/PAS domain S-box-containing protein